MHRTIALTLTSIACAAAIAGPNEAHDRIAALPEQDRAGVFAYLLRKEGCGPVTRTFFQGSDRRGNATWNVRCMTSKKDYAITIFNDGSGSTKYMGCDLLKAMNAGTCFSKF